MTTEPETNFTSNKIVPVYGRNSGRTFVSIYEFLNLIADSFPAISAWKLTVDFRTFPA
jgi:hypothetical protein